MNLIRSTSYEYCKRNTAWWLHRRVDKEFMNAPEQHHHFLIRRIVEDLEGEIEW